MLQQIGCQDTVDKFFHGAGCDFVEAQTKHRRERELLRRPFVKEIAYLRNGYV